MYGRHAGLYQWIARILGWARIRSGDGLGSIDGTLIDFIRLATVTTVTASAAQVPEGTALTLTATVRDYKGTIPTGSVEFFDDGGSSSLYGFQGTGILDGSGEASLIGLLPAGTHSITGAYTPACCRLAGSYSTALNIVVTPAAPHAPVLAAPLGGATGVSVSVTLSWSAVPFATTYDVYFGTTPSPPFWGNVSGVQCVPGAWCEHEILLDGRREEWLRRHSVPCCIVYH